MVDIRSTWYSGISQTNKNQWNNVVKYSDQSTIFHRYEWIRSVELGFDYEPRHVAAMKGENPVGVMPNFVKELPLPDGLARVLPSVRPLQMVTSSEPGFGGPITVTNERESLDRIFETLEDLAGRRDVFHSLQSADLSSTRYGTYLQSKGYEPTLDTCLFFLDLGDDWETIREQMDKERRRSLRRAGEQDHRVEILPLDEDFERTYDYYVKNTQRVGGNVLPRAFLQELADRLGNRIRVFTAIVDGETVGRYVHLLDEEASVLRHWLSAIPDTEKYEYYPSELLHERAIKWGIEHGYDRYGFGPTRAHFSNSVFRFKQKYGVDVVPLFEMEKGYSSLTWPLFKSGRRKLVAAKTVKK